MRRQANYSRGDKAESRVREYIDTNRQRIWSVIEGIKTPNFTIGFGIGRRGYPDLVIKDSGHFVNLEVKSVLGISGGAVGRIRISRSEWCNLVMPNDEAYDTYKALILEIVVRGRGQIYAYIKGYEIDKLFEKVKSRNLSLTIWQILRMGTLI